MKKIVLFFCAVLLCACLGCAETVDPKDFLYGVWYEEFYVKKYNIKPFKWDSSKHFSEMGLDIFFKQDKLITYLPGIGGPFPVTEVKQIDKDTILFTFFFDRGGFYQSYLIHKLDNKSMWVELLKGPEKQLIHQGKDTIWCKVSKP